MITKARRGFSAFDGKMKVINTQDEVSVTYDQLQFDQYFQDPEGAVVPTNIQMKLVFDENLKNGPKEINEDGSFDLGVTKFTGLGIEELKSGWRVVSATANVNGKTVTAQFNLSSPFTAWAKLRLEADELEAQELWAQTVFGKPYPELSDD